KTREMVQKYSHWEIMEKHSQIATPSIRHTKIQYKRFNDWESSFTFPCVSVLDWNDDGFDDFFVTDRWQPSQLLENQGDGTFKDVSEKSGLKIDELAICSLFADFDNDGEQEALIGGGLVPTRYFEKVNGVFKEDLSQKNQWKDIRFVVSGSVVDINGDGLLDVYLCTYGLGDGPPKTWVDQIIRPSEKQEFCLKMADSHYYLSRGGLPNIVLMNRNGKLQRVENLDEDLAQWRCSFQTVWNDIDSDGDLDAYICNDFAADQFLRNDTPKGEFDLQFTEFSADVIPDGKMGFGMGASWGDYNNDGNLDLYVSNMYSKAGTRILKKFPVVDERIKSSARGNFLYENNGDGSFKQVAGFGDDQQHVNKVGWSFGGQFADFNNDALMDIYVPSGFYTPPEIMKSPGDR
ncbi:MAG: VCBS repeat-containing protein, partial [Planctomycetota bacterium]